jgi:UDP-glucose 4-epimerase
MKILVVGGAGYIGSHMVKMLHANGMEVVTFDNLETGFADAVRYGRLIEGDLADKAALDRVFTENQFDGVMHFASYIQVGESVREPAKYYQNNFCYTLNLLNAMVQHKVRHLIFSSTAAIFGMPEFIPIDEAHPKNPINPYGHSKLMVEQMLANFDHAYGLKSACLRYFNAAGADPECELGPRYEPASHLIPLVLQSASGRKEKITVFGTDYDTPDGTCIRDYIHINDLCDAHILALDKIRQEDISVAYNLGNGDGYSVKEVLTTAEAVIGREIPVEYGERRAGDPDRLVADSAAARKALGWSPRYCSLEDIISHAWQWEQKQVELAS